MNIIEAFSEYASNLQIEQAFDQFLEDYDLDHDKQLALINYCAGELVSTFATIVALNEDADLQDLFEQFCEELELSDAYGEILARCIEDSAEEFDNDNDVVEFDAPIDQDVRERKLRAFLKKVYTAISGCNSLHSASWAVPFITNLSVPGLWGNDNSGGVKEFNRRVNRYGHSTEAPNESQQFPINSLNDGLLPKDSRRMNAYMQALTHKASTFSHNEDPAMAAFQDQIEADRLREQSKKQFGDSALDHEVDLYTHKAFGRPN